MRVGVVDDHIIFTQPFAGMLDMMNGIRTTLVANSGPETLKLLSESIQKPDIILMDINMPGMDGIDTTRIITQLYPVIKIVALTAIDDEDSMLQMFEAGACAYLKKDIFPQDLETALYEVHQKAKYHADIYYLYEAEMKAYKYGQHKMVLSAKEMEVLRSLHKGHTIPQTSKVLFISVDSVKYYRKQLGEKFKTSNPVIMVVEAIRRGMISMKNSGEDHS